MKVLVVDDSVVFRTAIKTALGGSPDVKEVKMASNGKIALDMLHEEDFDAITIDLEMPVMDGVETIKQIREFNKSIPIIIFSAQNLNAANKTLKALDLGANDFVQKIEHSGDLGQNLKMIQMELIPKFKALLDNISNKDKSPQTTNEAKSSINRIQLFQKKPDLICIGSSTGGPDTLKQIFQGLKPNIQTPILIVQHMPPVFTTQFAKSLDQIVDFDVVEAIDGMLIAPGKCYLAPGDYHLRLGNEGGNHVIRLDQSEKVCFVRPSVDVMLNSVAKSFQGNVLSLILTGMGNDGAQGVKDLKRRGNCEVVIQNEESSVVFGMPKAVYQTGLYDDMTDIKGIIKIINLATS